MIRELQQRLEHFDAGNIGIHRITPNGVARQPAFDQRLGVLLDIAALREASIANGWIRGDGKMQWSIGRSIGNTAYSKPAYFRPTDYVRPGRSVPSGACSPQCTRVRLILSPMSWWTLQRKDIK